MSAQSKRIRRQGRYYTAQRRGDGTFKRVDPWSSKSEGCFIATAAYGTPLAQEINYLRMFREDYLKPHYLTKKLVYAYYKVSPPIAKTVSKSLLFRRAVRFLLKPQVILLMHWYKNKMD